MVFFYLFILIWLIVALKTVLFWVYLWQLKEYHIGRFMDHFNTSKGQRIIWNRVLVFKFIAASSLILFATYYNDNKTLVNLFLSGLAFLSAIAFIALYAGEAALFVYRLYQKKSIKPVLTKKVFFLITISFAFEAGFIYLVIRFLSANIYSFILNVITVDLWSPVLISLIILAFQPITVLGRNVILNKARSKRNKFEKLIVVGITGSYGKTSTKEYLAAILSEKFRVLKTKEHQNSEVGISHCILNDLKPEHEIFICEMGAYNQGGIRLLSSIARPKIGILTGINEQHMATFGSQENIVKGKFELIESLPNDGIAIFNGDNEYISNLKNQISKIELKSKIFYSVKEHLDIWAEDIKIEKEWLHFKIFSKDGDNAEFKLNLFGKQNISNILAAACCARKLGMSMQEIADAAKKITAKDGAMKLLAGKRGLNILDSTYSANPDGIMADLDYLKLWNGKKVLIMPCMIELGKAAGDVHKKLGWKIAEVCEFAIITTLDRFDEIKKGALEKGMKESNVIFSERPSEIMAIISEKLNREDVILLESRVPKAVIENLTVK